MTDSNIYYVAQKVKSLLFHNLEIKVANLNAYNLNNQSNLCSAEHQNISGFSKVISWNINYVKSYQRTKHLWK